MEALTKVPVLNLFIPANPVMTVDRDADGKPIRYSLDAASEDVLQRQRLFAMLVGGPVVVYAGYKADVNIFAKAGIMALGVACTVSHFYAYNVVRKAKKP